MFGLSHSNNKIDGLSFDNVSFVIVSLGRSRYRRPNLTIINIPKIYSLLTYSYLLYNVGLLISLGVDVFVDEGDTM